MQRVDDLVASEGVDDEPLLIGGDDLQRWRIEIEDAPVEIFDVVDQRQLPVQAGLGDRLQGLAERRDNLSEAQHERLLRRVDREEAHVEQEADDGDDDEADASEESGSHYWVPPVDDADGPVVGGLDDGLPSASSGR